jgi:hypothetical protein
MTPETDTRPSDRPHTVWRVLRVLVVGGAVMVGLGMILLAATLGRCDAFGGRCPSARPALWDDDVFGMSAFGTAIAVFTPLFMRHPSRRQLRTASGSALVAALIVGLLVTSGAHG